MVPLIVELSGCVAEWRINLCGKTLKVNAEQSRVMIGRTGGR